MFYPSSVRKIAHKNCNSNDKLINLKNNCLNIKIQITIPLVMKSCAVFLRPYKAMKHSDSVAITVAS